MWKEVEENPAFRAGGAASLLRALLSANATDTNVISGFVLTIETASLRNYCLNILEVGIFFFPYLGPVILVEMIYCSACRG